MMNFNFSAVAGSAKITARVERDGKIKSQTPGPVHNIILDQGLNRWVTSSDIVYMDDYCMVGTGTQVLYRDSGEVTFSQAGTTVTSSASFFVSGDVGGIIKADSGEEARIISLTSATEVEVDISRTVATTEFGIHYTHQTGLAHQVMEHYNGNAPHPTFNGVDTVTFTKTHRFAPATAAYSISEVSYGPSSGFAFGMVNLAEAVDLDVGDELVVTIERYFKAPTGTSSVTAQSEDSEGAITNVSTVTAQVGALFVKESSSDFDELWRFGHRITYLRTSKSSSFALPGVSFDTPWHVRDTLLGTIYYNSSSGDVKYTYTGYAANSFTRSVTMTIYSGLNETLYGLGIYSAGGKYEYGKGAELLLHFSPGLVKDTNHIMVIGLTFNFGRVLVND